MLWSLCRTASRFLVYSLFNISQFLLLLQWCPLYGCCWRLCSASCWPTSECRDIIWHRQKASSPTQFLPHFLSHSPLATLHCLHIIPLLSSFQLLSIPALSSSFLQSSLRNLQISSAFFFRPTLFIIESDLCLYLKLTSIPPDCVVILIYERMPCRKAFGFTWR